MPGHPDDGDACRTPQRRVVTRRSGGLWAPECIDTSTRRSSRRRTLFLCDSPSGLSTGYVCRCHTGSSGSSTLHRPTWSGRGVKLPGASTVAFTLAVWRRTHHLPRTAGSRGNGRSRCQRLRRQKPKRRSGDGPMCAPPEQRSSSLHWLQLLMPPSKIYKATARRSSPLRPPSSRLVSSSSAGELCSRRSRSVWGSCDAEGLAGFVWSADEVPCDRARSGPFGEPQVPKVVPAPEASTTV